MNSYFKIIISTIILIACNQKPNETIKLKKIKRWIEYSDNPNKPNYNGEIKPAKNYSTLNDLYTDFNKYKYRDSFELNLLIGIYYYKNDDLKKSLF